MIISVVEVGEKLHVATRRRFEDDVRRHFVGEVQRLDRGRARLDGYGFVFQPGLNEFVRLAQPRTRVIGLGDSGHAITVIPPDVRLEDLAYEIRDGRVVMTDGTFSLEVNEFGASR